MNTNHKILILLLAALAFSASGCYLPGLQPVAATPAGNLTMTAFARLLETHQPTASPTAKVQSTKAPSASEVPPATPESSATPKPTLPPPTSTTTAAPSITPSPTISHAGPGMRSGTSIAAEYLTDPPNINGDFSDWDSRIYQASSVVYGAANRSNDADLSSTVMVGWTENYLYIGARVKDKIYVQNATGEDIFKGDSVEILLDTNVSGDYYYNQLSLDDYQLGVSPGNPRKNKNPEAYLWYPNNIAGSRSQVLIGILGTSNGYHIELAIPWSVFGVSPYDGQHFGFAFSVSDNDTSGTTEQQSMISNVLTRVLASPMTWGDLSLIK